MYIHPGEDKDREKRLVRLLLPEIPLVQCLFRWLVSSLTLLPCENPLFIVSVLFLASLCFLLPLLFAWSRARKLLLRLMRRSFFIVLPFLSTLEFVLRILYYVLRRYSLVPSSFRGKLHATHAVVLPPLFGRTPRTAFTFCLF